jgi:hypothetical protein
MPINSDQPLQCSYHTARSPTSAHSAEYLARASNHGPSLFFGAEQFSRCRSRLLAASRISLFLHGLSRLAVSRCRCIGTRSAQVGLCARTWRLIIAFAIDRRTYFLSHCDLLQTIPSIARRRALRSNLLLFSEPTNRLPTMASLSHVAMTDFNSSPASSPPSWRSGHRLAGKTGWIGRK